MLDDEFDNLPDEFADIQGVDWAQLLAGPSNARAEGRPAESPHENVEDPLPISPHSNDSSLYFPDDDLDSAFLAELDQVEQRVIGASQVASSSLLGGGIFTCLSLYQVLAFLRMAFPTLQACLKFMVHLVPADPHVNNWCFNGLSYYATDRAYIDIASVHAPSGEFCSRVMFNFHSDSPLAAVAPQPQSHGVIELRRSHHLAS